MQKLLMHSFISLLFCRTSTSIADVNVIFCGREMLTNAAKVRCCSHGCAIYVYAAYCTSCFVKLLHISKPHCMHAVHKMWPIATDVVWYVSLCVSVPFTVQKWLNQATCVWVWTCVGARKHALDKGPGSPPKKAAIWGDNSQPTLK